MGDIVAFHKYCSISFEVITTLCLADRRRVIYLTKGKGKGKEKRKKSTFRKKKEGKVILRMLTFLEVRK